MFEELYQHSVFQTTLARHHGTLVWHCQFTGHCSMRRAILSCRLPVPPPGGNMKARAKGGPGHKPKPSGGNPRSAGDTLSLATRTGVLM